MQMVDGEPVPIQVRKGRTGDGIPEKHVRIIRKLIPIRDAVREVLKAQEVRPALERSSGQAAHRLVELRSRFRPDQSYHGLDHEDNETGEVRETIAAQPPAVPRRSRLLAGRLDRGLRPRDRHRQARADLHRAGDRTACRPPIITSAADALAVVLNERGHVDLDHIAELLHRDPPRCRRVGRRSFRIRPTGVADG
jgi:N12 class adenine-specific DNA methylase